MMGDVLGFRPTVVAYRGSAPAITDLLGGQVDLLWDQVTNAITQVQAGALHGIAVTSPQRLEQLKDVPTTAELGMPEVSYTMWHGLYVAKGTPKETVDALNAALRKALSDPGVLAKLKDLGTVPFPEAEMSPEAHAKLFASDLPRVAKLVESSGIKAERGEVTQRSVHGPQLERRHAQQHHGPWTCWPALLRHRRERWHRARCGTRARRGGRSPVDRGTQ